MLVSKSKSTSGGKRRLSPDRRRLTDDRYDEKFKTSRQSLRARLYITIIVVLCTGILLLRQWYLYHTVTISLDRSTLPISTIARKIDTSPHPHLPPLDEVSYLSYYPHGGFPTQRLTLENALTLCRLLGRTLLLPPLWIGRQVPWASHPTLQYQLNNASKVHLGHCRHQPPQGRTAECEGYNQWSQVSWSWLVDLGMTDVDVVDRWDFSDDWISRSLDHGGLGLNEEDMYMYRQEVEFDHQFTDASTEISPHRPYVSQILLEELKDVTNRLLHIDILSGSNRILLVNEGNEWIRNEVRSSIVIANDLIIGPAKKISQLLGGAEANYLAIDARIDGDLASSSGTHMREAWWDIGRRLGMIDPILENTERNVWDRSPGWRKAVTGSKSAEYPLPPVDSIDPLDDDAVVGRYDRRLKHAKSGIQCPRLLHSKTTLLPLNTPLFLSASTNDPQSHPALRLLYSTYPCLFTLDTPEIREIVDKELGEGLINDLDGYEMSEWVRKWIAWEVAARGREVVGTNGTAWGKWAEEIVQPVARGLPPIFHD